MVMAGRLRKRIKLQSPNITRGTAGGIKEGWTDEATVWADELPFKGDEFNEADLLTSERIVKFRIRFRQGIREDWRVLFNDVTMARTRIFAIVAIITPGGIKRRIELDCRELPSGERV